jgi:hypothetical protein
MNEATHPFPPSAFTASLGTILYNSQFGYLDNEKRIKLTVTSQ